MKKTKLIAILLMVVITIGFFPQDIDAITQTKVSIEGKNIEFNKNTGIPFIDENGRTQVPFRVVLESVGAEVKWDQESKTAVAQKDNISIEIPIGENYILKNKVKIENDTHAIIPNDKTYLPIRIVMEALGYDVNWIEEEKLVTIDKANSKGPDVEEKINAQSYLESLHGIWHVVDEDYFIRIDKKGSLETFWLASEMASTGKIITKNYDPISKTLTIDVDTDVIDREDDSKINVNFKFEKISEGKQKITENNPFVKDYKYEIIYYAKDYDAAMEKKFGGIVK